MGAVASSPFCSSSFFGPIGASRVQDNRRIIVVSIFPDCPESTPTVQPIVDLVEMCLCTVARRALSSGRDYLERITLRAAPMYTLSDKAWRRQVSSLTTSNFRTLHPPRCQQRIPLLPELTHRPLQEYLQHCPYIFLIRNTERFPRSGLLYIVERKSKAL